MSTHNTPRTTRQWEAILMFLSHPQWTTEKHGSLITIRTPERTFAHVYPDVDEFGDPYTGDADAIRATPDALRELVRLRYAIENLVHQYSLSFTDAQEASQGLTQDEIIHNLLKRFIDDLESILTP